MNITPYPLLRVVAPMERPNKAYPAQAAHPPKLPDSGLIGSWVIDGHTIHVDNDTHVHQEHGIIAENAFVRISGQLLADVRSMQGT